jgi:hypothetical protein
MARQPPFGEIVDAASAISNYYFSETVEDDPDVAANWDDA